MKTRKTIKEWELETGIKLRNTKGFIGKKSKIRNRKITKEAFLLGIKKSEISVKTQKGMDFLTGQDIKDEQWRSYIKNCENRRRERKNK